MTRQCTSCVAGGGNVMNTKDMVTRVYCTGNDVEAGERVQYE